ncbi:DUF2092 domain-containing protein [Caballeronia sp. LZ032]|uniref:DUF2092 domain-containing protein n=1 Tax=Caballeronia sp. LZ032 TaxID=3038565 RepID=UPI00285B2097|nr:DUF2092 domain-containing protein [Caballeronia sp. LZ032]MDR5879399.1 DUF2092 domain-containing protein [Caballeronia sp. LZ032]
MDFKGFVGFSSLVVVIVFAGCASPAGSSPSVSDTPAVAASATQAASATPATQEDTTTNVAPYDQQAVGALSQMGDYLRSLSQFEVRADSSTDLVLDNGQNASYLHHTVIKVRRPNRLRADISGSRRDRGIVYDGRDFVIFNTGDKYFSRNPAPPTIDGLVQELATTYNIETPLADLFYWGNGKVDDLALTSAQNLGLERVEGHWCTHYAYRQSGIDWELWIEKGSRPLPCRMVITDVSQASRPRHEVTYQWNTHVSFGPGTFMWRPLAGSHQIELKPATGSPLQEAQ